VGYDAEGAVDGNTRWHSSRSFALRSFWRTWYARLDGLALLRRLKDQLSDLTFVLITAQGTIDNAVARMKEGADDYLTKPVDPQRLRVLLNKSAERRGTLRKVNALRHQLHGRGVFDGLVGEAPAIRDVDRVIERAAPTDASVLIFGESGTGKGLVAQTIHQLSTGAIARL